MPCNSILWEGNVCDIENIYKYRRVCMSIFSKLARVIFLTTMTNLFLDQEALSDVSSDIRDLKKRLEALEQKQNKEVKRIEEKTDALAQEVDRSKLDQFLPEKADLKSEWGMGPAASSVYRVKKGLSIGGYGEGTYRNFIDDAGTKKDNADLLRLVTYLGYKFNESILFNSEIEFEHATTDGIGGDKGDEEGEVSVEFAYLDFLFNEEINARVGLMLIPLGFVNEIHEPPFFHGVRRPEVEQVILPSTWRENGVGIFGQMEAAGKLEYRTYLVNGLRASRFSDSGIRGGRQQGNRASFEDVAWTGRVDYNLDGIAGLLFGGAFWIGNSGQDDIFAGEDPSVSTTLWDAHAQYRYRQLELRLLGAWGTIDDTEILSTALEKTIAEEFFGWYAEVAYDVLPHIVPATTHYLAPYFRYEALDTQASVPSGFAKNESLDKVVYTVGLSYKPYPDVVLKLDYRNFETDGAKPTADEIAAGFGFAF